MRNKFQILILPIALSIILTGCSFETVFKIVNLSNKSIKIEYSLNDSTEDIIFRKPKEGKPNVYELTKATELNEIDYNSGKANFSINKTNRIEVNLKPNEVLILGSKRGHYNKDQTSQSYVEFNINYLEIENGKDTITLVNGAVELMFSEIKRNEYGITIE